MRPLACLLLCAAFVLPMASAGWIHDPEVVDPQDADVPALDVRAAWWTRGHSMGDAVEVHVRVTDLTLFGQPLLDPEDRLRDVRYYYTLRFNTSAYPSPITVRCIVGLVETSPVQGTTVTGDVGATVGTECRSTRVPAMNNRDAFAVTAQANRFTDVLTIVLRETSPAVVDISPGTTFTDLTVETATGSIDSVGSIYHADTVHDQAGPGRAYVLTAGPTIP